MTHPWNSWAQLRGAVGVLTACVIVAGAMWGATHYFRDVMAQAYQLNQARASAATRSYLSIDDQAHAIAEFYPALLNLEQRGIFGVEHRLSWVEALDGISKARALPELAWEIGAQTLYTPDWPLPSSPFKVFVSSMKLTLGLHHEGDLVWILAWLTDHAEGLYSVHDCTLTRVASRGELADPSGTQLRAVCALHWYTLAEQAPPGLKP